jgi:hypothetical protein
MTTELETLTRWVAVLAVAGAVQTLLLVGGALAGWIAWRRAMASIDAIEQRHIAPISAQVSAVVDDIHDVTQRIRHVDDAMKHRWEEVGGAARVAKEVVADRLWPAVGIVRAVSAGLKALSKPAPERVDGRRPEYAEQARMGRVHSR